MGLYWRMSIYGVMKKNDRKDAMNSYQFFECDWEAYSERYFNQNKKMPHMQGPKVTEMVKDKFTLSWSYVSKE